MERIRAVAFLTEASPVAALRKQDIHRDLILQDVRIKITEYYSPFFTISSKSSYTGLW